MEARSAQGTISLGWRRLVKVLGLVIVCDSTQRDIMRCDPWAMLAPDGRIHTNTFDLWSW
jgi:hypothetical protein